MFHFSAHRRFISNTLLKYKHSFLQRSEVFIWTSNFEGWIHENTWMQFEAHFELDDLNCFSKRESFYFREINFVIKNEYYIIQVPFKAQL